MNRSFSGLEERYAEVARLVGDEAAKFNSNVKLLAVSKTFPAEAVLECARLGQRAFGENYAQEGVEKVLWFKNRHPELELEWHFIGPLQANKTRPVAENFDWVESLCRERIARRLSDQRPAGMPPLNVLIEVNADAEEGKSGVDFDEAEAFAELVAGMPNLVLRGLMAIPRADAGEEETRATFARLRELFERLKAVHPLVDTLSMGMSADFAAAIAEGSTEVRVGSAIFGARDYSQR